MHLDDFDYQLPPELIAQQPLAERSSSRLLRVVCDTCQLSDHHFADLQTMLRPGDLLVMNNTRVLPARLLGQKPSGGKVEVMLERLLPDNAMLALVRANRTLKPGALIEFGEGSALEVIGREGEFFHLKSVNQNLEQLLHQYGQMPLPPYITRAADSADEQRYQTVYADVPGAVAAPTAGLHFDSGLLKTLELQGVMTANITLHVGAGTFQPVRVDNVLEHKMHAEYLEVSAAVCEQIQQTKANGGRVIAVGTTSVRSLETAAAAGELKPYRGDSRLFIYPGYEFHVIDGMITNFHLPKSTLLMLVSAFAGSELIKQAYQHAIDRRYRFFSYGDAMLLL